MICRCIAALGVIGIIVVGLRAAEVLSSRGHGDLTIYLVLMLAGTALSWIAGWLIAAEGFSESFGHGLACVFVPFFGLIYGVRNCSTLVMMWILGAIIGFGASYTARSEVQQAVINPQAVQVKPPEFHDDESDKRPAWDKRDSQQRAEGTPRPHARRPSDLSSNGQSTAANDSPEVVANQPTIVGKVAESRPRAAHVAAGTDPAAEPPIRDERPEPKSFRDYIVRNYADWIGDDATLIRQMGWLPGCKRPALAVRWGLGVTAGSQTPRKYVTNAAELIGTTGPVGPELARRLIQRLDDRLEGPWSKPPERFVKLPIFLAPSDNELMNAAKGENLDALMAIEMNVERFGVARDVRVTLIVKLIDVFSRKVTWTSLPLSGQKARATQGTAEDASVELVAKVMAKIDEQYGLAPMPTINEAAVQKRADALAAIESQPEQTLRSLAELRYYQAKRLLKPDDAHQAFAGLVGGKAKALAGDDGAKRSAAVEEWFPKPE